MEVQVNTLKKVVQDLKNQNKSLKKKINNLEDKILTIRGKTKFFINLPPESNCVFQKLTDFINLTKQKIIILTPNLDSTVVNLLVNTMKKNKISIQIITNERRRIRNDRPDLIKGFDALQLNSVITHIFNSNTKESVILQDDKNLLLSSTSLSEEDLNEKFNFLIMIEDDFLVERFKVQFNEQFPPFLRS